MALLLGTLWRCTKIPVSPLVSLLFGRPDVGPPGTAWYFFANINHSETWNEMLADGLDRQNPILDAILCVRPPRESTSGRNSVQGTPVET